MTPDNKTVVLHVGALNALVLGLFAVMAGRDPDMVREVVDTAEELAGVQAGPMAGYPQEDIDALQDIVAGLVGPIRQALADMEQADTMGKH